MMFIINRIYFITSYFKNLKIDYKKIQQQSRIYYKTFLYKFSFNFTYQL